MPEVGFLPPDDPRVVSTVETIQRELTTRRPGAALHPAGRSGQRPDSPVDGLTGGEGAFLACSFWLVNALHLIGDYDEAVALFERLLALRNDLGLLSEEYDPRYSRQVGNTPQAFSHVPLIQAALNLDNHAGHHCRVPAGRPATAAPRPDRVITWPAASPAAGQCHTDAQPCHPVRTSWSSTAVRSASRSSSSAPRTRARTCWRAR